MKSNESFIEAVLEKEKLKRAQIKAAKRRTVGICTSLALCFIIGLSALNAIGVFSAQKGFDSAAPESAPSLGDDAMFDAITDEEDEKTSNSEPEKDKDSAVNGSTSENVGEDKKDTDTSPDRSDSPGGWASDGYYGANEETETPKSDSADGSAENKNERIAPYWYAVIASVIILVAPTVFLVLKKKK